MPGKVIGEAKSLGVNLDNAHNQALDYLLGGTIPNSQLPPYVICSNFDILRITRLNRDYIGDAGLYYRFRGPEFLRRQIGT